MNLSAEASPNTIAAPSHRRLSWLAIGIEIVVVASLVALIAFVLIHKDLHQPFSCDELFTYYGCKASDLSELFGVLTSGGFDAAPPFYDVTVWQMQRFINNDHLALRLPATIGFVMMCICIYGMARRRCSAPYAVIALLTLPIAAGAFHQGSNARPYGLMLGFVGLALFCWQLTERGRWRSLALFGLAASLAAGVATHYYTILVLAPLALAEATRTLELGRKRIDVKVWVAFAFALVPLPLLIPFIASARSLSAGAPWLTVNLSAVKDTYFDGCESLLLPLLALLALGTLHLLRPSQALAMPSWNKADAVLIFGLIALPILAFGLGVTVTKAYAGRYVIAWVAGGALLFAFICNSLFGGRAVFGIVLVMVMLGLFLSRFARDVTSEDTNWSLLKEVARCSSQAARGGDQLAVLDADEFIQCYYYLDPSCLKNITLVDLRNERHAKLYQDLNRWLDRKGLGTFDQRDADWLTQPSKRSYVYRDLDFLFRIKPPPRLTIEMLDKNLYMIEAVGGKTSP